MRGVWGRAKSAITMVVALAAIYVGFKAVVWWAATAFEHVVTAECGGGPPAASVPPPCAEIKRPVPRITSEFFAIQTVTTTGYGSDPAMRLERVQALANYVMPLGEPTPW